MKNKPKINKGLFLMAWIGQAQTIDLTKLSVQASALAGCNCDAVVITVKTKKDKDCFIKAAPILQAQGLYTVVMGDFLGLNPNAVKIVLPDKQWLKKLDQCVNKQQPVFLTGFGKELKKAAKILQARKSRIIASGVLCKPCADEFALAGPQIRKAGLYIGFSSQSHSLVEPLLAVSWGARVIEQPVSLSFSRPVNSKSYSIPEFKVLAELLCDARKYVNYP